ncbi:MAG TPA: hypothetical protein V6C89_14995 [Drouetiella sp.]
MTSPTNIPRPQQVLEKFAPQIAAGRQQREAQKAAELAAAQARFDSLCQALIDRCLLGIGNFDAEDAIQLDAGEAAKPLAISQRVQLDYDSHEERTAEILDRVNGVLSGFGWKVIMGLGEQYIYQNTNRIRNTLLLRPRFMILHDEREVRGPKPKF